jgi:hypothetical protein
MNWPPDNSENAPYGISGGTSAHGNLCHHDRIADERDEEEVNNEKRGTTVF